MGGRPALPDAVVIGAALKMVLRDVTVFDSGCLCIARINAADLTRILTKQVCPQSEVSATGRFSRDG
jgi:hypothetical protein